SGGNGGGFTTPNAPRGAVISYYLANAIEQPSQKGQNADAGDQGQGGGRGGRGGAAFAGQSGNNRGPVKITIADSNGQVVRTIYGPGAKGVNRTTWDMSYEGATRLNFQNNSQDDENPFAAFRNAGPPALPGTYTATLTANGKTEKTTIQVEPD